MYKIFEFYLLSFAVIILQLLFLSLLKEFSLDFIKYIEISTLSQIIISGFGTMQFYFTKEKKKFLLSLNSYFISFILFTVFLLSLFYLYQSIKYFLLFITSVGAMIVVLINAGIFARFNFQRINTYYAFIIIIIKFSILYYAYWYKLDFFNTLIVINVIIIISIFMFNLKLNLNESGFSFMSLVNNFFGSGVTTVDKLYCNKFLQNIAVNYFIIYRIASFFQYLTEVIFRKERFEITSGKKVINYAIVFFKFIFCLFLILLVYFFLQNLSFIENILTHYKFNLASSVLQIAQHYSLSIFLISLGFLINSIAGLKYDYIYNYYSKKKLIYINLLNFLLFLFLIFLSTSIIQLSYSFLIVQIFNYVLVSGYYYRVKNL